MCRGWAGGRLGGRWAAGGLAGGMEGGLCGWPKAKVSVRGKAMGTSGL